MVWSMHLHSLTRGGGEEEVGNSRPSVRGGKFATPSDETKTYPVIGGCTLWGACGEATRHFHRDFVPVWVFPRRHP